MSEEENETTETTEEPEGTEEENEEEEESEETPENAELKKVIAQRDRAKAELRKIREEANKAKEKDEKADPLVVANERLVKAEARGTLKAIGITDKDDVDSVLAVLNLGDIDVDDNGEVDVDIIEERVSDLRRIFGGKPEKRREPRTSTRDRGGNNADPADPDAARYRRILGR